MRYAIHWLSVVLLALVAMSCEPPEAPLAPKSQTFAELRVVRRAVTVTPPGEAEKARAPHPRERLSDGAIVEVAAGGLAWLRRDGGATLLVQGPAKLRLRPEVLEVERGRVFADTPTGTLAEVATPQGSIVLAGVRSSVEVGEDESEVYVLRGEVRTTAGARARTGERMKLTGKGDQAEAKVEPAIAWSDWTGGLATTDASAQPAPYGVGTVGARRPGMTGSPHFPLAIQRLHVSVTVTHDFAVTEVDQTFFNPSSEVVEGVYRFRTPPGATLHRFGVDRGDTIIWGYVKEKKAAAAQYQQHVYEGSTEDPALLEWDAPGVYRARLYPIAPGQTRQVVVRYAEWLGRTGDKGDRRLYVYPMAAEGAEGSLPHIEEFSADIDVRAAGATEVRAGMAAVRRGDVLQIRQHDLVPRADLAVELFDAGLDKARAYRAPHTIDLDTLPSGEHAAQERLAEGEADYLLVPIQPTDIPAGEPGLDLAIVVDTSAATDNASLAIARSATRALLAHLSDSDRAVVFAGDDRLRPILPERASLAKLSEEDKRGLVAELGRARLGGASDLGSLLSEAAAALDPARRGALVYIGDGRPTVGELGLLDLRERLAKLPRPVRVFALGVGDAADMHILDGLSRGAFAERVGDGYEATTAALRLLEEAERPVWLEAKVDLGPEVERVYPRDLSTLVADQTLLVVGRIATDQKSPEKLSVTSSSEARERALLVTPLEDHGDLRRRWAEGRLAQLLEEDAGRAAMVDLGSRQGIITPVTSLYVPTTNEMTPEDRRRLRRRALEAATPRDEVDGKAPKKNKDQSRGLLDSLLGQDKSAATASAPEEQREGGDAEKDEDVEEMEAEDAPAPEAAVRAESKLATGKAAQKPATVAPPAQIAATAEAAAPTAPSAPPAEPTFKAPVGGGGIAGPGDASPSPDTALGGEANEGERYKGDEGQMGNKELAKSEPTSGLEVGDTLALQGQIDLAPQDPSAAMGWADLSGNVDDRLARDQEASSFGMIGLLTEGAKSGEHWGPGRFNTTTVKIQVGDLGRFGRPCGAGANVPLAQRVILWRERLATTGGAPAAVASVYRSAIAMCEAPTWRERSRLLSMLLDAIPSVSGRVGLWRILFDDLGAADSLYRGILARVKTPDQKRELSMALGLRTIEATVLAKTIADAKTPEDLVTALRALVYQWPDDLELALRLLDAYEDAGDGAGARALANQLRARPDADARTRTAVGELYLRLAATGTEEQKSADESEARRAFGEIVEFSPDDPVARRRLGDLLRAHGWHAEAARQYQTLASLTPDDPSVMLLLAAASQGLGKLEEAVKWTEKGGMAGAPDVSQGPAATARAFAATYLAWGKKEARERGDDALVDKLDARLGRVLSAGRMGSAKDRAARVTLVWSHPELHPALWSNALGAPMPAPEGDATLGIAQVMLPTRDDAYVEVRLEPADLERAARLGAEAVLTVVFDEHEEGERIEVRKVRFQRGQQEPTLRFSVAAGEVKP